MTTHKWSCFTALALSAFGAGVPAQGTPDPGAFKTRAVFSVDKDAMTLTNVAAVLEARPNAPGFSWLRLHFYAFPFTAADIAAVVTGRVESMDARWQNKAGNPRDYNHSNAVLQLGVDKAWKVWQIDLAVPGHTCTVASSEREVNSVLQDYKFDGRRLRLKSQGTFVCDLKSLGIPNQRFAWNVDLEIPVFPKAS